MKIILFNDLKIKLNIKSMKQVFFGMMSLLKSFVFILPIIITFKKYCLIKNLCCNLKAIYFYFYEKFVQNLNFSKIKLA
jgi:hypothetical protein